jgi:hypothetical protein
MHRRTIYHFPQILTYLVSLVLLLAIPVLTPAQDDTPQLPTLRKVSGKVVDSLKHDNDFSYANDKSYLEQRKEEVTGGGFWDAFYRFFRGNGVRTVTYILLAVFFIFVVYRIIIVNNLFLFYSSKKVRTYDDEEEEDIRDENIDDKINKAIREKNYRSAIRYYYLKGLQLLNNKGLIRYHAQATNHDYVYQLSQNPMAGDFRFLTQVYDYVWYGEFAVNDEQFTRLQSDFKRFYQAVK